MTISVRTRAIRNVPGNDNITQLLQRWSNGDESALQAVTPLVYDELHRIARSAFSRERGGHTLQPTALLNEAYAKLIDVNADWQNRAHFFALAARMMRRLLVNHAKAKGAQKRGGDAIRITLQEDRVGAGHSDEQLLALDGALAELATFDPRAAELLELHYFGGLTYVELALTVKISESTVRRDLRAAKAWIRRKLSD